MAVEPWELDRRSRAGNEPSGKSRPDLRLVPSPPARRGYPIRTAVLVLSLAGLLGLPVVRATEASAPPAGFPPAGLSATQISSLDPMTPVPGGKRPRSARPAGGIAFVRCTRLWAADPNGRHERTIVAMPGRISSPTFSPDARTISFLAGGREIWLAGADGSDPTKVGELARDGVPIVATATGLTWSPGGSDLAFSLVTPGSRLTSSLFTLGSDAWSEGAAIWRLNLNTGELTKEGSGWPAPFWTGKGLWAATWQRGGAGFQSLDRSRPGRARGMSSEQEDLSAATRTRWLSSGRQPGFVALLRRDDGAVVLSLRRNAGARDDSRAAPPDGYRISPHRAPALSPDGGAVFANLIDSQGVTDVGLFDVRTRTWRVLDDAWDASTSPAPTVRGPLGARRALLAARDLVGRWNGRGGRRAALLAGEGIHDDLFPAKGWVDHQIGDPVRSEEIGSAIAKKRSAGWDVPATLLGRTPDGFAGRDVVVEVRNKRGRLSARPRPASPLMRIESIDDAFSFLRRVLPVEVAAPSYLPEGTRLARRPVSAWRWRDAAQGSVHMHVPGRGSFTVSYGNVTLAMGCGGTNDPEDTTVAGAPAVSDSLDDMRQVIWPATLGRQGTARFNVVGTHLSMEQVERVAASIERARRP